MTDPTASSSSPSATTTASLHDWVDHRTLATARRVFGRGFTGQAVPPGALVAIGIAHTDLVAYSRRCTFHHVDGQTFDDLLADDLLTLHTEYPALPVRAAIGWLFATGAGNEHAVSLSWGEDTLAVMKQWGAAVRGHHAQPRLNDDWLFVAAGVSPAEVATRYRDTPDAPVDQDALYAMAALRGAPTPAR